MYAASGGIGVAGDNLKSKNEREILRQRKDRCEGEL